MIEKFGIGIDIVDVTAFEKIPYSSKRGFYEKIFLPSEIKYCLKYKNPYERFAGKFAIKEAVKKSIRENISPLKIMVSHSNSKPTVSLIGTGKKNYIFIASISHDKKLAVGVVISERSMSHVKKK
jgi:holo-[acyl-carrier protein] synthase